MGNNTTFGFTDTPMTATEQAYFDRLTSLMKRCEKVEVFEVEGTFYEGTYVDACKRFIKNNPDKADFSVWLDNNYKILIYAKP